MTTGEEGGAREDLRDRTEAATDAIRLLRQVQDDEVHPQLLVLAAARVTGEPAGSVAFADGLEVDELLAEVAGFASEAGGITGC